MCDPEEAPSYASSNRSASSKTMSRTPDKFSLVFGVVGVSSKHSTKRIGVTIKTSKPLGLDPMVAALALVNMAHFNPPESRPLPRRSTSLWSCAANSRVGATSKVRMRLLVSVRVLVLGVVCP